MSNRIDRKSPLKGLGRTQINVLLILASPQIRAASCRDLAYHHPQITEAAAYSAVMSLGRRGLVDVAGFDHGNRRTYKLTDDGHHAVEKLLPSDDEADDV